jgi:hypothetical protein
MQRARSPPGVEHAQRRPHQPIRKGTSMDTNDQIDEFLAAVDELRGEDETVRSTAHTSSVSAEGWAPAVQNG